ncbi:MAG: sec-independent protein translocase protein TatA [Acidimicrobiia bacterium]|jgi:sec-independent protein translocase protein TatA|nr:sec-independent protein translocase protein TatA [Acidimicrobiia bacterium]
MQLALGSLGSGELIVVLVVVLVIFGGSQLPKLARSLGEAQKELRKGMNDDNERNERKEP